MDKKQERTTDYDKLPLLLDVSRIQQIMGISLVSKRAFFQTALGTHFVVKMLPFIQQNILRKQI